MAQRTGSWLARTVLVVAAAAAAAAAAGSPPAARVAITVDDLPIFPELPPARAAMDITRRLLAGFARHRWPVTGFVNQGQLEDRPRAGRAVLRAWVRAGYPLGNHTYSHASLSETPVAAYLRDIARDDRLVRRLRGASGGHQLWFRYPYLATGRTLRDRRRVERWLAAHGYRIAPVSLANSDWEFAEPYDAALKRGDRPRALAIRRAYLAYTAQILPWTRQATRALLGREPAYVLLIHANRLNAEAMDALAKVIAQAGLRPMTLARAVADPAYRIADGYLGEKGAPSLTRWALALGRPTATAGQPPVPVDIAADYARIEAADPDARTPLPENRR